MMIVGEGPGKDEDSTRKPFTGPAGRLMDKIWGSVGLDTNDFYCTNAVLCRPVAPWEAMKQNLTPQKEQLQRCKPYLERQVQLINPWLIITVGRVGTEAVMGPVRSMGAVRGQLFRHTFHWLPMDAPQTLVFPMLHPAAILHASRDPQKQLEYKEQTWTDIQKLKSIIEEHSV
jgi:uracil-DNA glycosylase family 4